jgi:hypothetical protein
MTSIIKAQVGDILIRRTTPSNLKHIVYLQILTAQKLLVATAFLSTHVEGPTEESYIQHEFIINQPGRFMTRAHVAEPDYTGLGVQVVSWPLLFKSMLSMTD